MFETSKDILFIVSAGGIGLISILLAWLLVYLVLIVKRAFRVIRLAESLIEKIDLYISKPISAVSGIIDQVSPLIKFFAKRRR